MSQYRLHIDIPLGTDEDKAIAFAKKLCLEELPHILGKVNNKTRFDSFDLGFRLGHDEDRQRSNYLEKTDEGHVTKKKCKVEVK